MRTCSADHHEFMGWVELGDAMRQRREQLGLTQLEVQRAGGPSVGLQSAVENKRSATLSASRRRAIEHALRWKPGTVDRVLETGELGDGHIVDEPHPATTPSVEAAATAKKPARRVHAAALGEAVKARRAQLGMTLKEVASAGGPSDTTLIGIESGAAGRVNPVTLGKLDEALDWEPGSAAAVLEGGAPTPTRRESAFSRLASKALHPGRMYGAIEPHEVERRDVVMLLMAAGDVYRSLVNVTTGQADAETLKVPAAGLHGAVMNLCLSYFGGQEGLDGYLATLPDLDLITPRDPQAAFNLVRGKEPGLRLDGK